MVNHYKFPIDVYDAGSSPRYAPDLLGTIMPNAVSGFQVLSVPDGRNYHFVLHKRQGNVVKDILLPGATLNASLEKDGWQLVLEPDYKAPSNKGVAPLKKAEM